MISFPFDWIGLDWIPQVYMGRISFSLMIMRGGIKSFQRGVDGWVGGRRAWGLGLVSLERDGWIIHIYYYWYFIVIVFVFFIACLEEPGHECIS